MLKFTTTHIHIVHMFGATRVHQGALPHYFSITVWSTPLCFILYVAKDFLATRTLNLVVPSWANNVVCEEEPERESEGKKERDRGSKKKEGTKGKR